ncbi:Transcription initiation factor IIE subunit alpha [Aphelenchoides besseyi]|nr:Transcription initiation factor IIE subunit alpha [Aphelenchoides besseyi]KAI6236462.1 Transcription initiation factor IIE subunit alpha [Aphelenchoides besseyi]
MESAGERLINEIPDRLKILSLCLVKSFYGPQHYVLLDFVQRNVCVKEDQIREILKIEHRLLRTLIVTLKVDKFIKERTIAEENEGRSRKVNYYHVNYKAILNVTKYKIDRMRQKIESHEQDNVRKASYICTGCQKHYDALEIGTIYDPTTQELTCWQCNGKVVADKTAGPTEETRSSLAKFNEQMSGIFSMLKEMDGVRFARHILEPPITLSNAVKTQDADNKRVLQVGERMFSTAERGRSELYSNGITVSIGEQAEVQVEAKAAVPWLQHNTHDEPTAASKLTNGNELSNSENRLTQMIIQAAAASDSSATKSQENGTHVEDSPSLLDQMLGIGKTTDINDLLMDLEG